VSSSGKFRKRYLLPSLLLLTVLCSITLTQDVTHAKGAAPSTTHYVYVFPDGGLYVYDMDNGQRLVKQVKLPMFQGGRGAVVDPATASLYLSYHGDGGPNGNGSLLKYNLLTDKVVWTKDYPFGIDSMAISPDGNTIYMPDGQASNDGTWHILNASDGSITGSIFVNTGAAAHNTIVSLSGSHVYLGALNYNYLVVVDTSTNQIIQQIGPLVAGVRPFTINRAETLAFTTSTGYFGFQVSSISSGNVLYSVPINGFTASTGLPSHGISLSPDEKEVYVIDTANSYVHVFDVSGLPDQAPRQVADIPLRSMQGTENPCRYDCNREGWLLHSRDGRFVYVGDSGDVIDTSTRKVVANLPSLYNTRKYLEIDWSNGVPVATSSRSGLGYSTNSGAAPSSPGTSWCRAC